MLLPWVSWQADRFTGTSWCLGALRGQVTHLALEAAIKVCGPGVPLKEIGATIHSIADKHRFAVVRDFIGHGVGKAFHASPQASSSMPVPLGGNAVLTVCCKA